MSRKKKVLAIVLAGGEGKRLMPLTEDRAKPAVPFGGGYRLIDFALSNLVNSGYLQIVVLTQYKSHSLDRHLSETWRLSTQLGNYVASVPAQQRRGKDWFLGSANAIFQSMNLIDDADPDIVVVVGADHVYRMDFADMVDFHINSGAKATVAGVRQNMDMVTSFGVIETDPNDVTKISRFVEKPESTTPLPDDPNSFLASMGNYVFDRDAWWKPCATTNSKRAPSTIWAVTSCRTSPIAERQRFTTSPTTTCPAPPTVTASTGATWVRWIPTTTPTWT